MNQKILYGMLFATSLGTVSLAFAQQRTTPPPMPPQATEFNTPVPPKVTPGKMNNQAPSDAIVLFDGSSISNFVSAKDGSSPVPMVANSAVPAGVDYNMWLGPAPNRDFNANRFHFNFRWFWDYAGGLMTDWGVHEIDIALYAMGVSAPKSVMASGGKFAYPDDASETPDTLQTVYEYEGFNMLWEHATGIDGGNYGTTEGIAFIGNNATLVVNRGGWKVIPETETVDGQRKPKVEEVPHTKPSGPSALELHAVNFVEAMTANDSKLLKCGIQTGSVAAINAQMGNIAYKTGKKVYWDASKNLFTDTEANQLIKANYHNGWVVPKV